MTSPEPKPRWFYPTPGQLLVVLLAIEAILLFSERWMPKGWAVLLAVAAVGVFFIVMGLWFIIALLSHRRFQFSIRTLLLLTVAVAMPFSWLALEMKRAKRQREVVEALLQSRGYVGYDYQVPVVDPFPDEDPTSEPDRLLKPLGKDFFHDVTKATLSNASKQFPSELRQLQSLMFFKTENTDAMLPHLEELPHLKSLIFSECDLNNNGLQSIAKIVHLEDLCFADTNITDKGLCYLKGLRGLESLEIFCTTINNISPSVVSDQGLTYLTGLQNLKSLNLSNTSVTAEGVKKLQQALPNCKIEYQ